MKEENYEKNHEQNNEPAACCNCLLYTSDAADDLLCVDLGDHRTNKKKKKIDHKDDDI